MAGRYDYSTKKLFNQPNNTNGQNTYLAAFDNNGKFNWVKTLGGGSDNLNIDFDKTGNVYLSGNAFFSFQMPMKIIDSCLPAYTAHGEVPLIGKIKNTWNTPK